MTGHKVPDSPGKTARGRWALRFFVGLCACLALPVLLVMQMPVAPAVGIAWDLANLLGYLAMACCLLLFIYAGRPRPVPPFSGRFFANLHRDLGYITLILVATHIAILLVSEPLLLEHLKPTAPYYMLAGLLASLILLTLVISSIPRWRRRVWPDYRRFKLLHAWLAIACVALSCWHVLGSHFYVNTAVKLVLGSLAATGVFAAYAWGRYRRPVQAQGVDRIRDTAVYSHRIAYGSLLLMLIVAIVIAVLRVPQ